MHLTCHNDIMLLLSSKEQLGDIAYCDLPDVGNSYEKGGKLNHYCCGSELPLSCRTQPSETAHAQKFTVHRHVMM